METDRDDLEFLNSQHVCLYDSIFGDNGTGLCVTMEVRSMVRSICSFSLDFTESQCMTYLRDIIPESETLERRSQYEQGRSVTNPRKLYDELNPSKLLPIVELKYKGRVTNKLYSQLLTSAMRAVGRIDKQMKTAMLAYPAILMGRGVHYTKVVFPIDSKFCHAIIEGYGKKCNQAFFDRYAKTVREILNRHLSSISLAGYRQMASSRKVIVRGLEGIQLHMFCDAVVTTVCIRDLLFIRELNRVLEQSVTLFLEVKFPLEKHITATISLRTYSGVISECSLMVKGGKASYLHVMAYVERMFSVVKGVVLRHTTDMYSAFENTKLDSREVDRRRLPSVQGKTLAQTSAEFKGKRVRGGRAANKPMRNINALLKRAPDLFATGYARDCQKERQPLIIEESEAKTWIQKKFLYKGSMIPRSVVKMDVDSGRILMVCANDSIPFPYFKTNVNVNSKDRYPLIPCCQKSGNYDIPKKFSYEIEGVTEDSSSEEEQFTSNLTLPQLELKPRKRSGTRVEEPEADVVELKSDEEGSAAILRPARSRPRVSYIEKSSAPSQSDSDAESGSSYEGESSPSGQEVEENEYDFSQIDEDEEEDPYSGDGEGEGEEKEGEELKGKGNLEFGGTTTAGNRRIVRRREMSAASEPPKEKRFLRHKHISVLPPTLCKALDMRQAAFDLSFEPKSSEDGDRILSEYLSRRSRIVEKGSIFATKGGFHTQHSTALECVLISMDMKKYVNSSNKCNYVHMLRKQMSEIPNICVLVSQEIWAVSKDRDEDPMIVLKSCDEEGYHCPSGMEPQETLAERRDGPCTDDAAVEKSIVMHSITETELRNIVSDRNVEFDMDLFYRIVEEYFKVNIYCISMLKETMFEIPRHRFYHCRPSRTYRECVVLYKSKSTAGQVQYNLVVSNSVTASDKELRGCMPRTMSKRCHALLVNSHNITLIKNGMSYMDVMSDLDYMQHFTKDLRAVAIDGAGKSDFLVLGVSDAFSRETKALCCIKCLQVQAPNTAQWMGPPIRIPQELAVRIFGSPKSRDYDGLVYDGYGVEDGFVVFTREATKTHIDLPLYSTMEEAKTTAQTLWSVANHAYHLYSKSRSGGLHGWVEFEELHTLRVRDDIEELGVATFPSAAEGTSAEALGGLPIDSPLPRRQRNVRAKEYAQLMLCMDILPEKLTVSQFYKLISRVAPSVMIDDRLSLTAAEGRCIGQYASSTRDPIGMTPESRASRQSDTVKSFASRESAIAWCNQRDINEMSCCTMPMVDYVNAGYSRGATSYIYKEKITQRLYLMCNGNMVRLESCLLTCLIWREKMVVCPPCVSEIMIAKSDSMGNETKFNKRSVGLLYESIMTTGSGCEEGLHPYTQKRQCSSGRGVCFEEQGTSSAKAKMWFSSNELNPQAPSNLSRYTSTMEVGDVMSEEVSKDDVEKDVDLYTVPTSAQLREMDHAILVLHPDGNMEVAMSKTAGRSPPFKGADYRNHLKVLLYGTMSDYVAQNPKAMASVLDM